VSRRLILIDDLVLGSIGVPAALGEADDFIRRLLLHTFRAGFHRIRHYGLLQAPPAGKHRACARAARRGAAC
jgi:hypothetical protein